LIVSSIGFETHNQTITSNDVGGLTITIKLQPKVKALETVVALPHLLMIAVLKTLMLSNSGTPKRMIFSQQLP
jgi:hypothetical protein